MIQLLRKFTNLSCKVICVQILDVYMKSLSTQAVVPHELCNTIVLQVRITLDLLDLHHRRNIDNPIS